MANPLFASLFNRIKHDEIIQVDIQLDRILYVVHLENNRIIS